MISSCTFVVVLLLVSLLTVMQAAKSPDCSCTSILCDKNNGQPDRNYQCTDKRYLQCSNGECSEKFCPDGKTYKTENDIWRCEWTIIITSPKLCWESVELLKMSFLLDILCCSRNLRPQICCLTSMRFEILHRALRLIFSQRFNSVKGLFSL
jgi:hypothetical protein